MSNKIEISRELAERLIRAIDESQPSPLHAELRAILAAEPVDANAHLPYRVESLSEFLSRDATPVVERQPVARIAYDDEDAQAAFEALNPMPRHITKFKGGYAATEFNAWDAHEFCKKWDGFKQCAKLYAEQPAPVAVSAFAKGFNTIEQMGGKYRINMAFENRDDAWAAYTELSKATASIDKVKELNP